MTAYYGKVLDDVVVETTAPADPYLNQLWWNSTNNTLTFWNGSAWIPQGTSAVIGWDDISDKPATFPPTTPIPQSDISGLANSLSLKAPLASPVLTGTPTTPTAVPGTNTTQIASTAFVGAAVSTGVSAGLGGKEDLVNKGVANGYASLDASAKVPAIQLPSYVDDVQEFANLAEFPESGTVGIIYVALDTNKTYRWSGSAYVEISASPGTSDALVEGTTNLYYTAARSVLKADVTYVDTGLGTKAASSHTHAQADVTDLVNDLSNKAPISHTHTTAQITGLDTALTAKADTTALANYLPLVGGTLTGKLTTKATLVSSAGFCIPPGTAPTTPGDGDVWMVGSLLYYHRSGVTYPLVMSGGTQTISGNKTFAGVNTHSGIMTFSAKPIMTTSTTSTASINLPHGAIPSAPVNGDLWSTTTGFYGQVNGATVGPLGAGGGGGVPSDTNPVINGTAAPGVLTTYSRGDHVHPVDTSRVALGGDTMTGPLVLPSSGVQAASVLNFGTAGTGIYGDATSVRVTNGGALKLTIGSAVTTPTQPFRMSTGSVGTPGYSFSGDTDAGLYLNAAGDVRIAVGGADVVQWKDDKSSTFSGKIIAPTSTTASAGLNAGGQGAAPTTPVDGDIWLLGSQMFYRSGASSMAMVNHAGTQTISGTKTFSGIQTFTAKPIMTTSTATTASINLPHGVQLTSGWADGDIWSTSAGGFYGRVNGVTKNLSIHVSTTAPSSPVVNDLWLDIT